MKYFISIFALAALLASSTGASAATSSMFNAGDLIKGSRSTVYYFAPDGHRYVFPNEKVYFSWYRDFSNVRTIPDNQLAVIPLGRSNVTYRPGYKMAKITSDPRTYVVDRGGVLRHVATEQLAETLYGLSWKSKIDDIPDEFFINYRIGTPIQTASDYDAADVMTLTPTISIDKGFNQSEVNISIGNRDASFVPTTFTVKSGTRVTWTNRDTTPHVVKGQGWESTILEPNASWSRVFDRTGSYDYQDSIYPVMQGTINVVP